MTQFALDCDVRVISGNIYSQKFKVEFALQRDKTEKFGKNYWLCPNYGKGSEFILDLGCEDSYDTVELVNAHNAHVKDRGTKEFQVFLR